MGRGGLLVWTFCSLGRNLTDTVVTRQAHTLVVHGRYRWIRHPLYDSAALLTVAVSLIAANWFLLLTGTVLFCLLVVRTRTEEENLVTGRPIDGVVTSRHPPTDWAPMSPLAKLRAVKVVHTLVWAFFAGCIFAVPVLAWGGRLGAAAIVIAIVFVEVLIILANNWRCPLTDVAARYTDDRRDNFDIYLPLWLARHNKRIFGWLFAAGLFFTLAQWQRWTG